MEKMTSDLGTFLGLFRLLNYVTASLALQGAYNEVISLNGADGQRLVGEYRAALPSFFVQRLSTGSLENRCQGNLGRPFLHLQYDTGNNAFTVYFTGSNGQVEAIRRKVHKLRYRPSIGAYECVLWFKGGMDARYLEDVLQQIIQVLYSESEQISVFGPLFQSLEVENCFQIDLKTKIEQILAALKEEGQPRIKNVQGAERLLDCLNENQSLWLQNGKNGIANRHAMAWSLSKHLWSEFITPYQKLYQTMVINKLESKQEQQDEKKHQEKSEFPFT